MDAVDFSGGVMPEVEKELALLLAEPRPPALREALLHAVMPGGKRIRPRLCMAAAEAAGGSPVDAVFPACAIELLHCYTLVHDDLPAMDDDVERRGRPSVWARYGEATAILTGDALQAMAFRAAMRTARNTMKVLEELGSAAEWVVRGQSEELSGGDLDFIYRHKTADLFMAAAAMGAYAGGGSEESAGRLKRFAACIGLAFQHEDDLLDGDSPYQEDDARKRIARLTAEALASLEGLPGDTSFLSSLASGLAGRKG